ncbi:MAG: ATP-binding protein [Nitrospiraceae bacterium]|nr:MAG: ATP-binding protein [Nitrospiraceae bacterium]
MPLKEFTSRHFLGRDSEIKILANVASQAGSGDAGSIILLGKRGIGKTELLRNLYNELFNSSTNTVPFFYAINTAFASVESFSEDYMSSFVLQYLAFTGKDPSLINAGIYSLEDLRAIAAKSEAAWISEIIDNYSQIKLDGDLLKLFSYVISLPYYSYRHTGIPVLVIIDDFHKIRKLSELSEHGYDKDLWMLFENQMKFRFSPHIIAGYKAELHKMFFEETSFGEHLEIISLGGLSRHDSSGLFRALCAKYSLSCEADMTSLLELFGGNPFYIKSFVQAARQAARSFSPEDFWEIYISEITKGKIYTYWTSILKSYIRRFELRKPTLALLYNLCENGTDDVSNLSSALSVKQEDIDYILGLLHTAGIVETGFSAMDLVDDLILIDLIKGLYHKEIIREPWDRIRESLSGERDQPVLPDKAPAFDLVIPAALKAELVAVKSLEQVARYYRIPPDAVGQLQVSLIDLFSAVLATNGTPGGNYKLKFILRDNVFSVEILTSRHGLIFTDSVMRHIKFYIDDIRVEEVKHGSKITLIKELKKDIASAQ